MSEPIVIHVAAEPTFGGLYQECSRCGYVLQDYTGSHPMVPEDDAGMGIPFWSVGRPVAVQGTATWVMPDGAELAPGEIECRATS
ncbi:hypothetical protein [Nonomuraea sp. NPDC023979]|uniref:hypothetical protein n=1 Tax=Nonomuraea sp. NPDC023979 TaxID=3154796 RepID=UPI0033E6C9AB